MDYKLLFIQIIGFLGTVVYFLSYQFKENKNLFKVQSLSFIFYGIHFFLLEAYTGALSSLVAFIRVFCLSSNNEKLHTNTACIILCIIQILVGLISYQNLYSVLPIIANVLLTIAGYTNNPKQIRIVGMFINSPLWIAYDILVGSWAGVIDELITEASIIISIFRYKFTDNK